jgi:hypothetical protein
MEIDIGNGILSIPDEFLPQDPIELVQYISEVKVLFREDIKYYCNGICMTGWDVGVPYSGIAYAHPECDLHSGRQTDGECFHGYPQFGSGCSICEQGNENE